MANFGANIQWNINQIDLAIYSNNRVDFGSELNGSFPFNGTTYPDRFFIEGEDGPDNRFLYAYGDFATDSIGLPTSGIFNAFQEFDANASSTRWFIEGLSVDAAAASTAAQNGQFTSLIQDALSGNDTITLSPFNDVMDGFGGNDSIKGGGGNDTLNGGTGSDTAVFDGSFASATISFDGPVLVISTPADGEDRLSNFEFVNFNGDIRSVESLNGPPVPVAKTDTATEDGSVVTGQLVATDPNSDPLTFSAISPSIGGLSISSNGSYSFDPSNVAYQSLAQGQTAMAVAGFAVSDGFQSVNSTLTITVTGVNDLPVISDAGESFETLIDTQQDFAVTATDVDGDTLTYTAADPENGTVTGGDNGQFTYTPDGEFVGTDSIVVTVSDGNGGMAMRTFTVTVSDPNPNAAPVASPATETAVEDGPVVTGQLMASDADGDTLTFSPVLTGQFAPGVSGLTINSDGSFSFDPSDADYQSLAAGETMELLAGYIVSDGSLSDSSTLTITITGSNDAPVLDPGLMEIATTAGRPRDFSVSATDIDGDTLTYTAADPGNGTVTGGANGEFTYTPDGGFLGMESVEVTVSDGNGGEAMRTFVVTVSELIPTTSEWNFLLTDGFVGSVGGFGNVFGSPGFEDVNVLDLPGAVVFDPSFNRAGNIVRVSGDAGEWNIVQSGSSAILTDGDTFLLIPGGTAGLPIVFDDGARTLIIDQAESTLKIGDQAFGTEQVQVTASADGSTLPTGADPDAAGRLLYLANGSATVSGRVDVFGTAGFETVTLLSGSAGLDPSFNRGGDTLIFNAPATGFMANLSGSNVFLEAGDTDVLIPIGTSGMTLAFPGGDERTLRVDNDLGAVLIGDQQIGVDAASLMAIA